MSGTARNEPCPCGSGKKYKKCCGRPGVGQVPVAGRLPQGSYYQFHLMLMHTEPLIWRRFVLRADASFWDLHQAIQELGWTDSHLWHFVDIQQRRIFAGPPAEATAFRPPVPDASQLPLAAFFTKAGDHCGYEYDFGDGWVHMVTLEEIQARPGQGLQRMLLDGAEEFPYEDCGGVPGHQRLVSFWATGKDPWNDEEALHDLGWDEKPEPFDLAEHKEFFDVGVSPGEGAGIDGRALGGASSGPSGGAVHGSVDRSIPTAGPRRLTSQEEHAQERQAGPPVAIPLVSRVLSDAPMRVMDEDLLARVEVILEESLERIHRELGLDVEFKSHKATRFHSTCKLEFSVVQDDGLVMNSAAEIFLRRCQEFGLQPEDLGRSFIVGGETRRIVGLRPRAGSPVLCQRLDPPAPPDLLEAWTVEKLQQFLA